MAVADLEHAGVIRLDGGKLTQSDLLRAAFVSDDAAYRAHAVFPPPAMMHEEGALFLRLRCFIEVCEHQTPRYGIAASEARTMQLSRLEFLAAASAAAALPSIPGSGERGFPRFTPRQMRSDLDFLVDTMLDVSVDPFDTTPQASFDAERVSLKNALTGPLNIFQFYLHTAPLFASLGDGHLYVSLDDTWRAYRASGGTAFPLQVSFGQTGVRAVGDLDPSVPAKSGILAIDGTPMTVIETALFSTLWPKTLRLKRAFASSVTLRCYLLGTSGVRRSYALRIARPDGTIADVTVAATSAKQVNNAIAATLPRPSATAPPPTTLARAYRDYTFSRFAEGRVGYIDYLSCNDLETFKTFLHDTFESIARQPIDGLIIDIRQNGGGNSDLNDVLWGYVTDKPFTQVGGWKTKVSDRLKVLYGKTKYEDIYGAEAWRSKDGEVLSYHVDPQAPGPNPLRYRGPVYLLIGLHTFSSAMMCATAAKDFNLAAVVGEETGEAVNSNGELFTGQTPRTKLNFGFPTKYWFGPKPRPAGEGVLPDVTIHTTDDDAGTNGDPVLNYAIAQITKR